MSLLFFFFFSSRRRHTSSTRDWSSDVCSSDLGPKGGTEHGDAEQLAHEVQVPDRAEPEPQICADLLGLAPGVVGAVEAGAGREGALPQPVDVEAGRFGEFRVAVEEVDELAEPASGGIRQVVLQLPEQHAGGVGAELEVALLAEQDPRDPGGHSTTATASRGA